MFTPRRSFPGGVNSESTEARGGWAGLGSPTPDFIFAHLPSRYDTVFFPYGQCRGCQLHTPLFSPRQREGLRIGSLLRSSFHLRKGGGPCKGGPLLLSYRVGGSESVPR